MESEAVNLGSNLSTITINWPSLPACFLLWKEFCSYLCFWFCFFSVLLYNSFCYLICPKGQCPGRFAARVLHCFWSPVSLLQLPTGLPSTSSSDLHWEANLTLTPLSTATALLWSKSPWLLRSGSSLSHFFEVTVAAKIRFIFELFLQSGSSVTINGSHKSLHLHVSIVIG